MANSLGKDGALRTMGIDGGWEYCDLFKTNKKNKIKRKSPKNMFAPMWQSGRYASVRLECLVSGPLK